MKKKALFDLEVYPNYMLFGVKTLKGKYIQFDVRGSSKSFTKEQIDKMIMIIKKYTLVGFNSMNYDDPVLTYMLSGEPCDEIYHFSKAIVEEGLRRWDAYEAIGMSNTVNSIDLIEIAHGSASLKMYGTRLGSKQLQDLPYDPHEKVSKKQAKEVAKYNKVDLDVTHLLLDKLKPDLQIRENIGKEYGINVMSRSDAQVAEDVFKKALGLSKKPKIDKPTEVSYKAPDYVKFKSKELNQLKKKFEEATYEINPKTGKFVPQDWLKEKIIIADIPYTVGFGGLHSNENNMVVEGDTKNADIASMYPSLIINSGKYPIQLGENWLVLYKSFRDNRIKIKHADKQLSAMLKIFLNGSYGKLNSMYSILYAPHLMIDTTVTGQLSLLMVIEALTDAGIKVISANTDGVEYVDSTNKGEKIIDKLGKKMNLMWEHASYKALYAQNVNSYVAIYDGYVKAKGDYADPFNVVPKLSKNVEYPIVFEAIKEYLLNEKPMMLTLEECNEPLKFTSARAVTGGGVWGDDSNIPNTEEYEEYLKKVPFKQNKALEKRNDKYRQELVLDSKDIKYLGKTVRWYYAENGSPIYYKKSGNRVPKTDGCKPMMKLTKHIPEDLDIDFYFNLCKKHLSELGVKVN